MNLRYITVLGAMVALIGCASTQNAMDRSVNQAENYRALSSSYNLDSASLQKASGNLDSAMALKASKQKIESAAIAEKSALEFRLALLQAERDSLKKVDSLMVGELRSDVERKILYENILENETKEAK